MSINAASPMQVSTPSMAVSLAVGVNAVYPGNKQDGDKMIWMIEGFKIPACYFPFFFGTALLLACHRWLWMVRASTLTDTVLAGMTVNCFRSELYLYSLSIIFLLMFLGPVPVSFCISSVSGK